MGTGIDPYTLTAWRFMIGGAALLPFALTRARSAKPKINISGILNIGALGFLIVCVSMLLLQLSIFYGKASLSAVIVAMNPLFVIVFALLLIKEKPSLMQVLCLVAGVVGLLFIIFYEGETGSAQFINLPLGIAFAVIAALTFGLYTVLTRKAVASYGNLFTNSVSFLIGGALLLVINLALGKPAFFDPSWRNLSLVLYLGLIITGLAYVLYFEGMKELGAATASVYFFLKPALASLLAYLILFERLSLGQLAGMLIIVLSLGLRNLKLPPKRLSA